MGIKFDENCSNQNEGMVNPGESDKTSSYIEHSGNMLVQGETVLKLAPQAKQGKL